MHAMRNNEAGTKMISKTRETIGKRIQIDESEINSQLYALAV